MLIDEDVVVLVSCGIVLGGYTKEVGLSNRGVAICYGTKVHGAELVVLKSLKGKRFY